MQRTDLTYHCPNCDAVPGEIAADCLWCDEAMTRLDLDCDTPARLRFEAEQLAAFLGVDPDAVEGGLQAAFGRGASCVD